MIESVQLINLITKESVLVDQDQSQFVLTEIDLGSVSGQHNTYEFYNQIGVTIDSTTILPRSISITGYIIGGSREQIKTNKAILNHLINPLQELRVVVYESFYLDCRPDYSVQYGKTIYDNNDYMCRFLIQGTCGNPLYSSVDEHVYSMSTTEPKFKFPWVIPSSGFIFGEKNSARLISIENDGDLPVGMVITLIAKGAVTNPKITSVLTQESLELEKALVAGESIEISTVYGKKYIHGTIDGQTSNYLSYLKYPSAWLQLNPGSNSIQYTAESGDANLQVTIQFSPGYLEVEE